MPLMLNATWSENHNKIDPKYLKAKKNIINKFKTI